MELSSATVAFTKGVLGFVADGLSVNTPQVRTDCISYLLYPFTFEKGRRSWLFFSVTHFKTFN